MARRSVTLKVLHQVQLRPRAIDAIATDLKLDKRTVNNVIAWAWGKGFIHTATGEVFQVTPAGEAYLAVEIPA